ncbi:thiamine-phosphate kinase [Maridesulfovibrio ferrireducens]|uniref:thiamine-phosphate kinase n=1 Tax=Maridesulfovibrio ferrireducens TaxID=246191 RepID=UPI001A229E47|nr:thiamine-phosphate kinase [Maridesulfovibrio ferrireducens]MBI9110466.1 thiamine-phosphate kinase [Maridesulfovibrio ferrireducens]
MKNLNSEQDFLALIDTYFPSINGHVTLGRGDDCSILRTNKELCISKDLFLEDVHFRRSYFSPADIGYKSLAVNISDIAAMGGVPKGFALGLIVPPELDESYWDSLLKEMAKLANRHRLILAGGDLCKGTSLGISVTVWGEPFQNPKQNSGSKGKFLTRGNAKPGDILFIHGSLGLARTGMLLLEKDEPCSRDTFPKSVQAHLRPQTRIEIGNTLSTFPSVTGLMDLSDGLARDLPRFINCCETAFGAEISLPEDLLHSEVIRFAKTNGIPPEEHAFQGGEDYALFGAASADGFDELINTVEGIVPIGVLTDRSEILLNGKKYSEKGFDHFSG